MVDSLYIESDELIVEKEGLILPPSDRIESFIDAVIIGKKTKLQLSSS